MNKLSDENKSDIRYKSNYFFFRFLTSQIVKEGKGKRREIPIDGQMKPSETEIGLKPNQSAPDRDEETARRQRIFKNILEHTSEMVRAEKAASEARNAEIGAQERPDEATSSEAELEEQLLEEEVSESQRGQTEENSAASDQSKSLFEDDEEMEE